MDSLPWLLVMCLHNPMMMATAQLNTSLAVPSIPTRRTVVFVRMQKTGSKTLLSILEGCLFTACPKRGIGAVDSKACQRTERDQGLRSLRSKDEYACHISSHCGIQAYDFVFNETLLTTRGKTARAMPQRTTQKKLPPKVVERAPPTPFTPRKPFVVTILRDAVTRYVSEFRHVCQSGQGQWDYSTLDWRFDEAKRLNFTVPQPVSKNTKPRPAPSISQSAQEEAERRRRQRHAVLTKQRAAKGLPPPPPLKPMVPVTTSTDKKIPPFHVDCSSTDAVLTFLHHPNHTNGARNRQTRMLAGAVMTGHVIDPRPESTLFDLAMTNLHTTIDVAIVFEKFHLSLIVLATKLGLPPPPEFSIMKERTEEQPKPHVNKTVLDTIARFNRYDVALHDEAKRILEASPEARDARNRLLQVAHHHHRNLKVGREDNDTSSPTTPTEEYYQCDTVTEKNHSAAIHLNALEEQLHYFEAKRCTLASMLRDRPLEDSRSKTGTHTGCVNRNHAATAKKSHRGGGNRTKALPRQSKWLTAKQQRDQKLQQQQQQQRPQNRNKKPVVVDQRGQQQQRPPPPSPGARFMPGPQNHFVHPDARRQSYNKGPANHR